MILNKGFPLPTSQSFSEIEHSEDSYSFPPVEPDWSEVFIEDTLLSMLKDLDSDRERVIFLLMAMAKDGYSFQHKDIATLFHIDYSWYMRIVRGIRVQLLPYLTGKPVKVQEKVEKIGENSQKNN